MSIVLFDTGMRPVVSAEGIESARQRTFNKMQSNGRHFLATLVQCKAVTMAGERQVQALSQFCCSVTRQHQAATTRQFGSTLGCYHALAIVATGSASIRFRPRCCHPPR